MDELEMPRTLSSRLLETIKHFWYLGITSFGGPGVHVVILRQKFVERHKWIDPTTFVDLFALGNALPGPGSTQLAFSIAVVRNGVLSGLLAFLCWSFPGAAGMAGLAAGVRHFPEQLPPMVLALLTGVNAAAVGLIALAAFQLSQGCITDSITRLLVLFSASIGVCYHAPWVYPVLVIVGGIATVLADYWRKVFRFFSQKFSRRPPSVHNRPRADSPAEGPAPLFTELPTLGVSSLRHRTTSLGLSQSTEVADAGTTATGRIPILFVPDKRFASALGLALILLIVTPITTRNILDSPPILLQFFTNMVIAGIIIFGGGPVVIPLLRNYTVDNNWVASRDFLLGFAILQAFPGPNFNFAVYLGVLSVPKNPILGGFLGWLGIFSPGILLKLSLLPLYGTWRKLEIAKSALRGLNAAASGLVWTAVWQLFLVGYIHTSATGETPETGSTSGPLTSDPFWGVIAASAFVATQWFKLPPAAAILVGAVAGLCWFRVVGRKSS
ncbi:chromate transporter-domain-containing protein [Flagelloscypha sp. PMI_526]|nr:chromate transporter-domain-containing protein [Flagelloscypha sp. PMI_526]